MSSVFCGRFAVIVDELGKHVDPLSGILWQCDLIAEDDIEKAVDAKRFEDKAWDEIRNTIEPSQARDFHINRVAYFVKNGLPTDKFPIQLDVQDQMFGSPIQILNGNHRVAAAIIRNDEKIEASVLYVDKADIDRFLPSSTPLEG